MFHGHLDYFQKPPLGGRPNTNPGDHHTSERSQPLIYFILSCTRTHVNRNSLKWHLVEGPVTYDFTLHDGGGVLGQQPLGHFLLSPHNFMVIYSPWLACEVALKLQHHESCLDHTRLSIRFQLWNCWGLGSKIDIGPPLFTLLQPERCRRMVSRLAGVISPSHHQHSLLRNASPTILLPPTEPVACSVTPRKLVPLSSTSSGPVWAHFWSECCILHLHLSRWWLSRPHVCQWLWDHQTPLPNLEFLHTFP